jgi:hypothetical protein
MFFIHPMTNAPPDPATQKPHCPRCSRETAEARLARHSEGLKRLAEIGLGFAEEVDLEVRARAAEARARLAKAEADAVPPPTAPPDRNQPDLALTFTRISRCVRLTFILEDRLHADFAARRNADEARITARAREEAGERRDRERATVERVTREAIRAEAGDENEFNYLINWMNLRLERDDIAQEAGRLPTEMLIARVCRDLGIDPDWDQWQGEDWLEGDDDAPPAPCPICQPATPPPAERERDDPAASPLPATGGSDPP